MADALADPQPPGLDPRRLVRLMAAAVERCRLDLTGLRVLTEAANGAYVVTPVLAAMAGARVDALGAGTSYASAAELERVTLELADLAGVADRVTVHDRPDPTLLGAVDVVTNSGQVRPIDAAMVAQLKPTCVVPLMYEAWEYRASDVDLAACRARGVAVAGTNEQHPAVDVFSFLGPMAVKALHDAGVSVYASTLALLCDNAFGPYIERTLTACGARVTTTDRLSADSLPPGCDAVVVALQPGDDVVLTAADAARLADLSPGTPLVQYWGDVDRAGLAAAGVPTWPRHEPGRGHMAVLPSAVGPEPIVRLQSGGLKVGEVLARGLPNATPDDLAFLQALDDGTTGVS